MPISRSVCETNICDLRKNIFIETDMFCQYISAIHLFYPPIYTDRSVRIYTFLKKVKASTCDFPELCKSDTIRLLTFSMLSIFFVKNSLRRKDWRTLYGCNLTNFFTLCRLSLNNHQRKIILPSQIMEYRY